MRPLSHACRHGIREPKLNGTEHEQTRKDGVYKKSKPTEKKNYKKN